MTTKSESSTPAVSGMIKPELIAAAVGKHAAVKARLNAAMADYESATLAVGEAEKQLAEVVAKVAAGDSPSDVSAMQPLQAAITTADYQRRLMTAMEKLEVETRAEIRTAMHEAHIGMYEHGKQIRLDAARKADAARAMLEEAEAEHRRGSRIINSAHERGAQHSEFLDQPWGKGLTNEATELAIWRG